MPKDERGLHIQTPEEFAVQSAHIAEDLGAGDTSLTDEELANLRPPGWLETVRAEFEDN